MIGESIKAAEKTILPSWLLGGEMHSINSNKYINTDLTNYSNISYTLLLQWIITAKNKGYTSCYIWNCLAYNKQLHT